jgi:hypothetical protein
MSTNIPATTVSNVNPAAMPAAAPAGATVITATAGGGNHGTRLDLQASYQALVSGLLVSYPPTAVFELGKETYTRDQVVAVLQGFIAQGEATKTAHQAWLSAVQTERAAELEVRPLRNGLRGIIAAKLGNDATEMTRFGFLPKKRGKKTAATKAKAAAKAQATRKARGTVGKKQRLQIQAPPAGATAGPPPTPTPAQPPAAPAAPTAPAAPAASPPNAPHTTGNAS